jgi:hypothetical protein
LSEWDKLLYIDADTLVIKNIDSLFNYPDGSMVKYPDDPWGFSGLFIIEPKNHDEIELYFHLLQNVNCFDGDLLGKLWFYIRTSPRHQIPEEYLIPYSATNLNYS